jgi:hypothetical protein
VDARTAQAALTGGIAGPVAFAASWAALGATTGAPYSPVHDAISRLAATGAPTQAAMTAGITALGAGLAAFGYGFSRAHGERAAGTAALLSGIASLGVAAIPLGSPTRDLAHGVAATIGYATLAATPLLARRPFPRPLSVAAGVACAACLVATTLDVANGLFQRTGISIGHAWIAAAAVTSLRRATPTR